MSATLDGAATDGNLPSPESMPPRSAIDFRPDLLLALPAVRFVAGLLFDTSAFDAGVLALAGTLLTLISVLATVVQRTARVGPIR